MDDIENEVQSAYKPFHSEVSFPNGNNSPNNMLADPALVRAMDGHPLFKKKATFGQYCVNCPICDGTGCDWGKDNESQSSTSISSINSLADDDNDDDDDDTDECSSITISDSDDESCHISGSYDVLQLDNTMTLSNEEVSAMSHSDTDMNTEVDVFCPGEKQEFEPPGVHCKEDSTWEKAIEFIKTDEHGRTKHMTIIHLPSKSFRDSLENTFQRSFSSPSERSSVHTNHPIRHVNSSRIVTSPGSEHTMISTQDTVGPNANRSEIHLAMPVDSHSPVLEDVTDFEHISEWENLSENVELRTKSKDEFVNTDEQDQKAIHCDKRSSCGTVDCGGNFVERDKILMRKDAVRRKGFAWRSKTFPKNAKGGLKTEEQARKASSLPATGSSLDLAPSLLNIYDGKASSDILSPETVNGEIRRRENENGENNAAPHPSQLVSQTSAPTTSTSQPLVSSPSSSSIISTSSSVVYRSGKLPSLSQPLDRPVSLMDTDSAISKGTLDPVDSKKRPLSVSSMSSVSTSSLPRMRKKRANVSSRPEKGQLMRSNAIKNQNIEEEIDISYQTKPSKLVSESYSSMDSGCVETDKNGGKYFDEMSIASSSEGGRGDVTDCVDASSSSIGNDVSEATSASVILDRSDSSLSSSSKLFNILRGQSSVESSPSVSKKVSTLPKDFPNNLSPDVVYPPSALNHSAIKQDCSFDEDSYVIRKMGSYINRNSATFASEYPGARSNDCDINTDISSPEQERRIRSLSRSQAREQFYSNYEEHYNKYVSSPVDSESSFETMSEIFLEKTKVPSLSTSPSTPVPPSPLSNTESPPAYPGKILQAEDSSVKFDAARNNEEPSVIKPLSSPKSPSSPTSPSSSKSPSLRYFDTRGSSTSPVTPSSLHKFSSSRSSRKREAQDHASISTAPGYVSYVQRVVMEIVDSERTYITSLEDIIYGYLEPLEHMLNMEAAKDDIMCLFSNIRDIYNFNRCFLADLEKTNTDPIKVAECFVRHNKGFVIYTEYCTNYPSAVEVLTRFMKHPDLSELCKERQMALGHGLPLGAYLLRPVQRILKYHLLLQNIAKNYEKEKRDVPVLKQAFQHMTHMAHHINEMKRKHEHAVRIQEIQSQLEDYVGEDLTRLGDLVLESTFQVYGAKASRQVFLFERGLLISKKKEGGMLSCKTFIKCSNLMLVEVIPNEPLSFHAIPFDNPRAQYTLQARNMEQKRRWCQEIKRLILESFKGRIPDNVKNLVMELGRDHDDDFVSKESLDAVRKHQHTAPEYLAKRRDRRKSGPRMPDFSLLRPQKAKRNIQRKNEKLLINQRAESKSPDREHKTTSKLGIQQSDNESTSLPATPVSESVLQTLVRQSTDPFNTPSGIIHATPTENSESFLLFREKPKIASSVSTSDISLAQNSESSSHNRDKNEDRKLGSDIEVVRRASSFRTAVRANPVISVDLSDKLSSNEKEISKAKKEESQFEWKGQSNQLKNEKISGEERPTNEDDQDDYVLLKEDAPCSPTKLSGSMEMVELRQENSNDIEMCETDDTNHDAATQSNMHVRSSSLPALVHAVNNSADVKPEPSSKSKIKSKKDFQSSDNVSRNVRVKGRMSRRDIQDATVPNVNGRYMKKKHRMDDTEKDYMQIKEGDLRSDSINGEDVLTNRHVPAFHDSFARHAGEKITSPHKIGLHIWNNSNDFGSQNLRPPAYSKGLKAKLTDWNSVDKLTKGSLCDLSHVHDDPWELNSQSLQASSLKNIDSGIPSGQSERSGTLPSQSMQERDNLDWLVYLKRNCLLSKSANDAAISCKMKRKSASILEQKSQGKDILDLKRRISAQSPYATPPRYYMTTENMNRFGNSNCPDKTVYEDKHKYAHSTSPLVSPEKSFNPHLTSHPRSSSSSSLYSVKTVSARPNSLDIAKLTDESNKMVAEMVDYMSKTSSCESIKTTNKFPTMLPSLSIEEQEDETSNKNNRLSVVSSVSTSSYESQASSSSDNLAQSLKSKLNSGTSYGGKRSETYENVYQSSVLSEDEDKEIEIPKSKNTFVPPNSLRKTLEEQRELETVLREHSLGSSSLGSRMAYSVPIPVTHKQDENILTQRDTEMQITKETTSLNVETSPKNSPQKVKVSENFTAEQSRYSLPATKEATEALMPPALGDCDIQQSDSGFSIHSNTSNVSDFTPSTSLQNPQEPVVKESSAIMTFSQPKPVTEQTFHLMHEINLQRQNSYESIDSTDSCYERRLSLALSADGFDLSTIIVPIYDDELPQGQVDVPPRRSIREYVQQIEEKFKPVAPAVCEVRKRQPGLVIQQKLQSLKENINYGKHRSISSRHGSEEREITRSKSQPPSQHRRQTPVYKRASQSRDDINIRSTDFFSRTKLSPSKSRESLNLTKSTEYINLSPSKENLTILDGKLSLPSVSIKNAYHNHAPGHESDWNRYEQESNEEYSEIDVRGQFVHKIKKDPTSPLSVKDQFFCSSDEDEGVLTDRPIDRVDQLSSEVDNLVIMKGWVKALITKFQDK